MTSIKITDSAAALREEELATELAQLRDEEQHFLKVTSDPYSHERPTRSLTEIRELIEIATYQHREAAKQADAERNKLPNEATLAKIVQQATLDSQTARTRVHEAAHTLQAAINTLRTAVNEYNHIIKDTSHALTRAGIPREGAEYKTEPIEHDSRRINLGDISLRAYGRNAVNHYLTAAAAPSAQYPEEPAGWTRMRDTYGTGAYWTGGAAHID